MDFEAPTPYTMTYESRWLKRDFDVTVVYDSIGTEILPDGSKIEVIYVRILNNLNTSDNFAIKLSIRLGYFDYSGLLFPNLGAGLADCGKDIGLTCHTTASGTLQFVKDVNCTAINIINTTSALASETVILYPNPTMDYFIVSDGYQVLVIINETCHKIKYDTNDSKINISNLFSGLYFVKIKAKRTKKIQYIKLVKN